jgi:hypothetical protein
MSDDRRSPIYAADAAGDEELKRYGEQREIDVMLDRELGLDGPAEVGNELMRRAAVDLRSRGIAIEDASGQELFDALRRISS